MLADRRYPEDGRREVAYATKHQTNVIGLADHGRDTIDIRWFIDLDYDPAFDFEYPVLGRIDVDNFTLIGPQFTPSPSANGLLQGGIITGISFGYPLEPCVLPKLK